MTPAAEDADPVPAAAGKAYGHVGKRHVHRQCDVALDVVGLRVRGLLDPIRLCRLPVVPSSTCLVPRRGTIATPRCDMSADTVSAVPKMPVDGRYEDAVVQASSSASL